MTPSAPVTVVNVGLEDPEVIQASWPLLRERGATRVYITPLQAATEKVAWRD